MTTTAEATGAVRDDATVCLVIRSIDPEAPPEGLTLQTDLRGIAIHWRPRPTEGDAEPATTPTIAPLRGTTAWGVQRVGFHALSPTGSDDPPATAEARTRLVRLAYAFAASYHPIPSDAEVYCEVRW